MGIIKKNGITYAGGPGGGQEYTTHVTAKDDLYAVKPFYRGMIVYVKDDDLYYKLVNDLPQYAASWQEYTAEADFIEMTEAEIDALFV